MIGEISVSPDRRSLGITAAQLIVDRLRAKLNSDRKATLVLSGGETPRLVYSEIPEIARRSDLDWNQVHLFWGDERSVGPDDPESNYRMAREALLGGIGIPGSNIHRIFGELPPATAAANYAGEIERFFGTRDGRLPVFDLVLLGLGVDGHIASLFPDGTAVQEKHLLVVPSGVASVRTERISLTLPVINNASGVFIIVSGLAKARILRTVLEGPDAALPAQRLRPGSVTWLVDAEAASLLKGAL